MPVTSQKSVLISENDETLQIVASDLLGRLANNTRIVADVFGTCPAHVTEWTRAAPLEPGKQAYVPAWVYLCLILWDDLANGKTGRGDGTSPATDAGPIPWPWSHAPV
jgi:hypothetical protein